MNKIYFIISLICICFSQDCDDNMLMFDCDDLAFCNNEPDFGFDCYVNNEFCEDFNGDGITDAWLGDGVDDITDYIGSAPDMGAYEFGESFEIMAGDTNFDGVVDILDIVRIVNQIMGNSEFDDDEFTAADFNADGIINILDIVQIVNYILRF